jgi:hypothetical protein
VLSEQLDDRADVGVGLPLGGCVFIAPPHGICERQQCLGVINRAR